MVLTNQVFNSPLEKLQNLLYYLKGQIGPELMDLLGVTRTEWTRISRGRELSYVRFEEIINQLGINSLNLYYQDIDAEVALKFINGEREIVPRKYLIGAYSSRRIGRVILDVLCENTNEKIVPQLLHSLQIGSDFFKADNDFKNVSTELYSDIYKMLVNGFGFSEKDLFWIGQKTAFHNVDSPFAKKFEKLNVADSYSCFLEEVAENVEQSYSYQLQSLKQGKVVVDKKFSSRMQEDLQQKSYGNFYTCIYSLGFGTTIGYFSKDKVFPDANLIDNLYLGKATSFEWDLGKTKPPRLFQ